MDVVTSRLERMERHHLQVVPEDISPFAGASDLTMRLAIRMLTSDFAGEAIILVIPNEKTLLEKIIAVRLRPSDDESCLWRLRCGDASLGADVQAIINATEL